MSYTTLRPGLGGICLLLTLAGALPGCDDALPPAQNIPDEEKISARIIFNDTAGTTQGGPARMRIRMANPDGSGMTDITEGIILGPAGRNRFAFSTYDNKLRVATLHNGSWEFISIPPAIDLPRFIGLSIAVSPNGEFLTYSTSQYGVPSTMRYIFTYMKGADNSGADASLDISVINECTPVFSRDSRRMAVYGLERFAMDVNETAATVYVFDTWARTSKAVGNVQHAGAGVLSWADFSPDGKKVVYADGATGELFIANSDGSGTPQVFERSAAHPVWSPKGDKIVYLSAGKSDVMMKNADGSGTAVNLTNSPGENDLYPQFSPDGKTLTYTSYSDDNRTSFGTARSISLDRPSTPRTIGTGVRKVFWMPVDP